MLKGTNTISLQFSLKIRQPVSALPFFSAWRKPISKSDTLILDRNEYEINDSLSPVLAIHQLTAYRFKTWIKLRNHDTLCVGQSPNPILVLAG